MIRGARPGDALAIATVQVRAWQTAYRGAMPDDYLDGLAPEQRAGMWRDLTADPGARRLVVAEADGSVVGFAAFGPSRHEPVDGELYAINVDPAGWGRGHGRRLLDHVTTTLRADGFAEAVLFVAVANDRARRIYAADGWVVDGDEVVEDVLGVDVAEIRYRRALR